MQIQQLDHSSNNRGLAPVRTPILKSNTGFDIDTIVEGIMGKPRSKVYSHEYDMVKMGFHHSYYGDNFSMDILSSMEKIANRLEPVDRVFFVAYFSKLFKNEARRERFDGRVDVGALLKRAEFEAKNGKRINEWSGVENREKGMVCDNTDPYFTAYFLFRNTYLVEADLPEKKPFISAPLDRLDDFINMADHRIQLGLVGLQALAKLCERFVWLEKSLKDDAQRGHFGPRRHNQYWDVFKGLEGDKYLVKMLEDSFNIYRCKHQKAYAKGLNIHGPIYGINDGEFNLYSVENNTFYSAWMERGKIAGACHRNFKPSTELADIATQIEALEAERAEKISLN